MEQMSCTARFIRPFVRLLASYPERSDLKLDRVQTIDPDSRVSLHLAYDTVQAWVKRTGDADLGLKAGRNTCVGSAGALEFAMRSANTLREAIALGQRYHAMLSDALVPRLEITGNLAVIRDWAVTPGKVAPPWPPHGAAGRRRTNPDISRS